jgi:hypothetical protein
MENNTRVLFCLSYCLHWQEYIFPENIIWEQRKNGALRDVDAADLVLWKVSRFSRNYPVCS